MRSSIVIFGGIPLLLCLALWLRVAHLGSRPMHTDEAVHAIKFGMLLEKGQYFYDANEYHGPTLNYFTLFPAWLQKQTFLHDTDEFTLRIVPAVFGFLLCAGLLLLRGVLGQTAVLSGSFLTAISPAMVFYSRYYIQEMLLVAFTFVVMLCGYFLLRTKKLPWAAALGIALGLMHATKETWIIAAACMLFSLFVVACLEKLWIEKYELLFIAKAGGIAIAFFLLISAMFFSSFGENPAGLHEAITTYTTYFKRAAGDTKHVQPWFYYGHILTFFQQGEGPVWSEVVILLLASVGMAQAFKHRKYDLPGRIFIRFLSIYALLMFAIYSAIPYKTPWNLLGFHSVFIMLAGAGVAAVFKFRWVKRRVWFYTIFFCIASVHLFRQAWLANSTYAAHPANPYVYGHSHPDVLKMKKQIDSFVAVFPENRDYYIQVICSGGDYWPLPWYLRDYSQIGWWNDVPDSGQTAALLIFSPDLEGKITRKLYQQAPPGKRFLYVRFFDERLFLRSGVELLAYVRKREWDILQRRGN